MYIYIYISVSMPYAIFETYTKNYLYFININSNLLDTLYMFVCFPNSGKPTIHSQYTLLLHTSNFYF